MNDKAIELINKALGLIYDTMHPTPKVAISNILTKIKAELAEQPVCDTCGGSEEISDPTVISMGPRPKIPCPKCSQPEAGEFTSKKNYIEDYLSKTRYRLTTGTRDEEMDKFARWFLEACDRLDQQAERIKKMYAGDLSPESRLAGYSVVVKAQKKRIKQLEAEKKRLEADIIKMNDKCVKIRRGLEADLEKYGQHGKLCPRRYGDELNPCLCGFDQARKGKGE